MSLDTGGPRYEHDCDVWGPEDPDADACRFVGRLREYDLYVHLRTWPHREDDGRVEVVARYADQGADYISGPYAKLMLTELISH